VISVTARPLSFTLLFRQSCQCAAPASLAAALVSNVDTRQIPAVNAVE